MVLTVRDLWNRLYYIAVVVGPVVRGCFVEVRDTSVLLEILGEDDIAEVEEFVKCNVRYVLDYITLAAGDRSPEELDKINDEGCTGAWYWGTGIYWGTGTYCTGRYCGGGFVWGAAVVPPFPFPSSSTSLSAQWW